jgi:hypothetical protein
MSTGELKLYCSSPPCLRLPFHPACEEAPARAFYSSRFDIYIKTWGTTCGPVVALLL